MTKIIFHLILLLFIPTLQAQPNQQRPNIIFILIDDQRYDFLSFLDHPWIETPHIDALAAQSMYFDNAFVTTSLCSPSRASIITGQYAHAHQVMDNDTPLPPDIPTFPKELQEAGYHTAFVGKWHMGGDNDMPRPGFDHWVSFKGQGPYNDPTLNVDGERIDREGYTTDLLTEYATAYITEKAESDTPYFLYLSHKAIHEPFTPAHRHVGRYNEVEIPAPDEVFALTDSNYADKPLWLRRQRKSWHGAERDFGIQDYGDYQHFFHLYSEAMLAVDESVGLLTQTLQELGQLDETVIIYYSDNGYMIGEQGLIDKRVMHEPSIRVPAFVHYPEVITAPQRKEEMILNLDIGPTILELAGVLPPSSMHGRSFAPMLYNEPMIWRSDFLYEYFIDPNAVQTPTILGLRTERYSYMTYQGVWDVYELYDLETDPTQQHNLLGHIEYGQDYGDFLRHVQRQDPALYQQVAKLDQRLSELIREKGGSRIPSWKD